MKIAKITVFVNQTIGVWAVVRHSFGKFRLFFKSTDDARQWAGARGCHLNAMSVAGYDSVMTGDIYEYVLSHKGDLE